MKAIKKVLLISYYWPPSGGAGVQRWLKLSYYLAQAGVEVHVVTVDPDAASYGQLDSDLLKEIHPTVKVYTTKTIEPYGFYKLITGKKSIPIGGFSNDSEKISKLQTFTRFLRGNLFLPDSRIGWNRFALKKCRSLLNSGDFDAIITTSPPHSSQLIGMKLKQEFHLPWLADLRDPWTGIFYYDKLFLTEYSKRRDAKMERKVLEEADAITVVSKAIQRDFLSKSNKLDPNKFFILPNGFDSSDFENIDLNSDKTKMFKLVYTGSLSSDYTIDGLIKALTLFKSDFIFEITGSIADDISCKLKDKLRDKISINPQVTHKEAIKKMLNADILVLIIPNTKGNEGILTGKLFEYLASKKPILCIGPPQGDAAEIIASTKHGETFDYTDDNGILSFISNLTKNEHLLNSKTYGSDFMRFDRKSQAKDVLDILSKL